METEIVTPKGISKNRTYDGVTSWALEAYAWLIPSLGTFFAYT
jgi:hypothetical protein